MLARKGYPPGMAFAVVRERAGASRRPRLSGLPVDDRGRGRPRRLTGRRRRAWRDAGESWAAAARRTARARRDAWPLDLSGEVKQFAVDPTWPR